jgi:hypothetical protein
MSRATSSASSALCSLSTSRSAITARARAIGEVRRQPGRTARAARTAASTSAAVDSGTLASRSPVAGSRSSSVSGPEAGAQAPPMWLASVRTSVEVGTAVILDRLPLHPSAAQWASRPKLRARDRHNV